MYVVFYYRFLFYLSLILPDKNLTKKPYIIKQALLNVEIDCVKRLALPTEDFHGQSTTIGNCLFSKFYKSKKSGNCTLKCRVEYYYSEMQG